MKSQIRFVVILGSLFFPLLVLAGEGSQTLKMKIDGMTCEMCVKSLETKLAPLCKKSLSVDLKKGEGVCGYESPVTEAEVLAAVQKAGFKAAKAK